MAKDRFLKGATLLAAATVLSKIIGAVYRIPLTNILGAEGIGLYQLVFPLYALVLTISSGAVPNAVAILTSRNADLPREEYKKKTAVAMVSTSAVGVLFALSIAALSYPLSLLQRNGEAFFGYIAIAPAVALVAATSVFRGFFQGKKNMRPTSLSNVVEAAIKLVVGLALAAVLKPLGIKYAVVGALFGVTVSELATLVVLYVLYRKKEGRLLVKIGSTEFTEGCKEVFRVSLPMAVCGVIANLTQFVDSVAVVPFLEFTGTAVATATRDYGLFSGPVSSLVSLPVVVGICLSVAIIPSVASDKKRLDALGIKEKTATAVKIAAVVGLPFFAFFLVSADGVIACLYPSFSEEEMLLAARLLRITSVSSFALLSGQIFVAVLQALGYVKIPIRNYAIGATVKVALDFILMREIGIYGVAVASAINAVLTLTLNYASYRALTGVSEGLWKPFAPIATAAAIVGALGALYAFAAPRIVGAITVGAVGSALYLVLIANFNVFSEEELSGMPCGDRVFSIMSRLRLR